MRLNFNIVIVDDDFEQSNKKKCYSINRLKDDIEQYIKNKGFSPEFFRYTNLDSCLNDESLDGNKHRNRIDFYLSDNNLEGKEEGEEGEKPKNKNGIDLYLNLKNQIGSKILCDFLLYTRSEIGEVVAKLSNTLKEKNDPNLFTRFTFVSRPNEPSDTDWHKPVKAVIDLIITRREEINNFRGLYAQYTSKIHKELQRTHHLDPNLSFCKIINSVCQTGDMNEDIFQSLHRIRMIRNSLMHEDEKLCNKTNKYKIDCVIKKHKITNTLSTSEDDEDPRKFKKELETIYEDDLKKYRDELKLTYDNVTHACNSYRERQQRKKRKS